MDRKNFIKITSLTSVGLASGIINPLTTFGNKPDPMFLGWLVRLVATSFVSSVVARLTNEWLDDCLCNGSTCQKNTLPETSYHSKSNIYDMSNDNRGFVSQQINDNSIGFSNASVSFQNRQYIPDWNTYVHTPIMNIEGPFLAGLCWASADLAMVYPTYQVRNFLLPLKEEENGGALFNSQPCYTTKFQTQQGHTTIGYSPNNFGGDVKVTAYDNSGVHWSRNYNIDTRG